MVHRDVEVVTRDRYRYVGQRAGSMRVAGGESQWRVVGGGVEVAGARGSTSRALLQGASIGWFERDGWGQAAAHPASRALCRFP